MTVWCGRVPSIRTHSVSHAYHRRGEIKARSTESCSTFDRRPQANKIVEARQYTDVLLTIVYPRRRQFRGGNFHLSVFHTISQKPIQLGSPNLTQMFHDDSWRRVYFGITRSKIKVTCHENITGVGTCTPVSAGFF